LLAAVSTAGVGVAIRGALASKEKARFQHEVRMVCDRAVEEIRRQEQADAALIDSACQNGFLVDLVSASLDRGDLYERSTAYSEMVSTERRAFEFDELLLARDNGDIVGASPTSLIGLPALQVKALVRPGSENASFRLTNPPALLSRCTKRSGRGHVVGLVGARHLDAVLARLARTLDVVIVPSWAPHGPRDDFETTDCSMTDKSGTKLAFDVVRSTKSLDETLHEVDRTVGLYAAISAGIAFIVAIFLARSVSRPLAVLAAEAGKVAAGEARPLRGVGSGEVAALASAFDRMLSDLEVTRRRLSAVSRIAAWREVARRVAHEIKNPLAPIRAAVETLRRLRARDDPRFDDYFDEATRTVLDEVHRITNIVTEFTRFARLPTPHPEPVDIEEVVRHVVQIHKPSAGEKTLAVTTQRRAPMVRADRDQIIQVLTNLIQNALDATDGIAGAAVNVSSDAENGYVSVTVADNGCGISASVAAHLFEPYATTKANGTGLGLAIAQRIAIEHDGELSYVGASANGAGAVFRLALPVAGPSAHDDATDA
jgi:signal transduction histidine kinase